MNNNVKNIDQTNGSTRYIEIDIAKGLAVILMMIFHYFYLGKHMNIFDAETSKGILFAFAKIAHTTFIIASGANLAISTSGKLPSDYTLPKVKRGLFLVAIGLIISYLTKIEFGDKYVRFGIMHFLGVALILSTFLMKTPNLVYITSGLIILMHLLLKYTNLSNKLANVCEKNPLTCFIGGIMNVKYQSLDHFSLIPYLGYFLLGSAIAFTCYNIKTIKEEMATLEEVGIESLADNYNKDETGATGRKQSFQFLGLFDNYKNNPLIKGLAWIGKRSMMFYVTHFVILYCIFKIIEVKRLGNSNGNDNIANIA